MDQIDPTAPPSGTGCADCEATGAWWLHLRRCAEHPAAAFEDPGQALGAEQRFRHGAA